eukprot:6470098-Amphidinium_carterae.1
MGSLVSNISDDVRSQTTSGSGFWVRPVISAPTETWRPLAWPSQLCKGYRLLRSPCATSISTPTLTSTPRHGGSMFHTAL